MAGAPEVKTEQLREFMDALASSEPTPGGGASSAVAGALGCAQAQMVAAITAQNPRYEPVREEMRAAWERLGGLRSRFMRLAEEDAEGYAQVARALKMPRASEKEAAERSRVLAKALEGACRAPFEMLASAGEALEDLDWLSREGSSLAKSDIICAAALLEAAANGASATVLANTSWMGDKELARRLEALEAHERELVRLYSSEIGARVERELLS